MEGERCGELLRICKRPAGRSGSRMADAYECGEQQRDHPGSFIGGWNVCGGFKEYRKAGGLCRPYSGRGMQYASTRR